MRKNSAITFLVAAHVVCSVCGTSQASPNTPNATDESAKLTGIWKMRPLKMGIANVVEFSPTGESRLYPYNCITKTQEPVETGHYTVTPNNRTIQVETNGSTQTLEILLINQETLVLNQNVGGEPFYLQYQKGSDLTPLCGPEENWEKERARRVAYTPSDFVPDPTIPPHANMERYVGQWADKEGRVQIEVKPVADGSYQLFLDANGNWTSLFNAVSWKGEELHYTSFAYGNRSDLFDHPYHKSSHQSFLVPEPDGVSMKYGFFINNKKYELILNRK